ncbi:MAG: selenium cofactor biosynthesis protein YqeC [Candidatus Eremiobacterota bacterium]
MTLLEGLGLAPPEVVALIGGGGKTTLLYQLGAEARRAGWRVLLTTTTRMLPPEAHQATRVDSPLTAEPLPLWTRPPVQGKLAGVTPHEVDALHGWDLVAVEADGSRGLPVKVHAKGEPVMPASATLAVAVLGLSALHRPAREVVHRFVGPDPETRLDPERLAGFLRRMLGRVRVARTAIVLNQAEDLAAARQVARACAGLAGGCLLRSWTHLEVAW